MWKISRIGIRMGGNEFTLTRQMLTEKIPAELCGNFYLIACRDVSRFCLDA
jgi:hypothetical protein